ncbi:dynein axonemal light chain 4 [Echinops telfairi]|uniref:Dynein axonemal light chain 4 n=1 Tax=Echinops telfairi TaxID=9371 RepID=A0AC55D557_ECHTE|nr:dynein axonemal light chain 4 [Echinops telfairi]
MACSLVLFLSKFQDVTCEEEHQALPRAAPPCPCLKRGTGRAGPGLSAHPSLFAAHRQHSDMPEEMRVETMELCVTACEKFSNNNESAAKMIKETMDKKFGSSWHVVIGEGFGFEITHEVKNLLYLYFGGTLAVCVWKCS